MDDNGSGSLARAAITGAIKGAIAGSCPQCRERTLFDGVVQFAPRCRSCGLDFAQFNVGDGPAAFLTMGIGALILGLALFVEFAWHPPLWLHALLWMPLTTAAVIGALRLSKAVLLHLEHRNQAREGRRIDVDSQP